MGLRLHRLAINLTIMKDTVCLLYLCITRLHMLSSSNAVRNQDMCHSIPVSLGLLVFFVNLSVSFSLYFFYCFPFYCEYVNTLSLRSRFYIQYAIGTTLPKKLYPFKEMICIDVATVS